MVEEEDSFLSRSSVPWRVFEVSLRTTSDHELVCGGAMLGPYLVITAATCLAYSGLYVTYGSASSSDAIKTAEISNKIIDTVRGGHNLAVVKLKSTTKLRYPLFYAKIAAERTMLSSEVYLSHWRQICPGHELLEVRQDLIITNFTIVQCISQYRVKDGMICANSNSHYSEYAADAGSPLTNRKGELVGILSLKNKRCCLPEDVSIFVDVILHQEWIENVTWPEPNTFASVVESRPALQMNNLTARCYLSNTLNILCILLLKII